MKKLTDAQKQHLSKMMKAHWRERHASMARAAKALQKTVDNVDATMMRQREAKELRSQRLPTNNDGSNALTNVVKYYPDDDVTGVVEILRGMIPYDELVQRLLGWARDHINETVALAGIREASKS